MFGAMKVRACLRHTEAGTSPGYSLPTGKIHCEPLFLFFFLAASRWLYLAKTMLDLLCFLLPTRLLPTRALDGFLESMSMAEGRAHQ